MTTLFSLSFGAVFVVFVVAAIVGHALVIEALVRPFFEKVAVANSSRQARNSLLPQPSH